MFQIPRNTEMSESMGSVSDSVPTISNMMIKADKCMVVPAKIYITINDPKSIQADGMKSADGGDSGSGAMKQLPAPEEKLGWFGKIKKSLGIKPKSEAAVALKAKEKEKKAEEKQKKWRRSVAKWQDNLLGNIKKGLLNNPVSNFIKDHWGKLLIGFSLLFLKPEQMKKVWEALKNMATWLWENGPDIFMKIFSSLETLVPMIGRMIGGIFKWLFGETDKERAQEQLDNISQRTFESDDDFEARKAKLVHKVATADDKLRTGGLDDSLFKKVAVGLGFLALTLAKFGPTGIIFKVLGSGITGISGLISKNILARGGASLAGGMQGPMAAGAQQGAVGLGSKLMGGASLAAGLYMAAQDGMEGAELAESWGVSKTAGVAGAVLGGTEKGLKGAFANMGKWALIGAGIGSFVPLVGTVIGGAIGAVVGAVLGFFGGENIAAGFNYIGKKLWMVIKTVFYTIPKKIFDLFKEWIFDPIWDNVLKPFGTFVKETLIDPLVNFIAKVKGWMAKAVKALIPDAVLNFFGISTDEDEPDKPDEPPPPPNTVTSESGEVVEQTAKAKKEKRMRDFKSRGEAEKLGYIDQGMFTGNIKDLSEKNKKRMAADLNNGKLTRNMLVSMIDSGNLGKEDSEYVKTMLTQFPKPKETKAVMSPSDITTTPSDITTTPSDTTTTPSDTTTTPRTEPRSATKISGLSDDAQNGFRQLRAKRENSINKDEWKRRVFMGEKKISRMLSGPDGAKIWSSLTKKEKKMGHIRHRAKKEGFLPASAFLPKKKKTSVSPNQVQGEKATGLTPSVSPTLKADTLNQVQGENAELSSAGNTVVAPTINNYYNNSGGGGGGTELAVIPTAQKGNQHRHNNIRR